ncbi:hypothetical protein [Microcoleus sp. B4-C1]|uniref:hypothetical protein n=1 Tax=Microcoleus sp. B4-C1 TaxID=2818660 RepID=UPI002FD21E98
MSSVISTTLNGKEPRAAQSNALRLRSSSSNKAGALQVSRQMQRCGSFPDSALNEAIVTIVGLILSSSECLDD